MIDVNIHEFSMFSCSEVINRIRENPRSPSILVWNQVVGIQHTSEGVFFNRIHYHVRDRCSTILSSDKWVTFSLLFKWRQNLHELSFSSHWITVMPTSPWTWSSCRRRRLCWLLDLNFRLLLAGIVIIGFLQLFIIVSAIFLPHLVQINKLICKFSLLFFQYVLNFHECMVQDISISLPENQKGLINKTVLWNFLESWFPQIWEMFPPLLLRCMLEFPNFRFDPIHGVNTFLHIIATWGFRAVRCNLVWLSCSRYHLKGDFLRGFYCKWVLCWPFFYLSFKAKFMFRLLLNYGNVWVNSDDGDGGRFDVMYK